MKRYAVIGLGKFGTALARELSRLGQKVVAVDADPEKAKAAQPFVEEALVADAKDPEALAAMGIGKADGAVVSLGEDRYGCTLVVLHLTRMGVSEIVAKVTSEEHAEILARVGATQVVFAEKDMAGRTAQQLGSGNVLDYLALMSGFSVIELAPPKAFLGKTLAELDLANRYGVQVIAVKELIPERVILIPGAEQVVKDSDILVLLGHENDLHRLGGV